MNPSIRFAEVAAPLVANGYRPVPIKPGTKYPGFEDWQHFAFSPGCERDFPQHGAGILLGDVVAIDIDVDDEGAAAACENAVREVLGICEAAEIPRRIGRYPRVLLPMRCATPFHKMKSASYKLRSNGAPAHVEILAAGQQFVGYAVHPDTGRPYTWNAGGDLLTIGRDQLPELDEAKAHALIRACEDALEEWGDRIAKPEAPQEAGGDEAKTGEGGRNDMLAREAGKLRRIGLSASEIFAALLAMNRTRCDPPLPESEVKVIAESIGAKPRAKERAAPEPRPRPDTALELMEREMSPIAYLCEPWIPEGLNILAGRPKLGKTTLLRQKLAAVAGGAVLFGEQCAQATALFLSLEEGDRLTRKKFELAGFDDAALASILVEFTWRRGEDGVLDLLRVLDQYPAVRYVGIDSLTRFRDVPDARTPAFVCDYEAVSALHTVAKARPGLCIDVVHHTRKAKSEDPIEDISGTFGVSAACDSYWVMRHHEDGAVLHVGGRLWESDTSQFQLRRGDQRWELVGEFTGARATQTQAQTLDALRAAKGMTPSQVAATFGIVPSSAFERLNALVRDGLARNDNGRYFAKL